MAADLLNGTLYVRCYSSWPGACVPLGKHPLHMHGEGKGVTSFIAGGSGLAVIEMSSGQLTQGVNFTERNFQHSNYHSLSGFTVAAGDEMSPPTNATRRQYGILAPALTRTTFENIEVGRALKAGLWASGWFIRVDSCTFMGNGVGALISAGCV